MNFKQLIGQYALGNLAIDRLPQIAYVGLEEGYESPSLIILAGIEKGESSGVVEQYFKLALNELSIIIPDIRTLAIEHAIFLANEIILNKTDIIKGVSEILNSALGKYDFHTEDNKFVYDSVSFEKVYSWYDTYDDLLDAEYDWTEGKSNKELMIDVKEKLFEELERWSIIVNSMSKSLR
jgi:hypothetical protein